MFIGALYATCYFMFAKFRATYNREEDSFRIGIIVIPCACLALLINTEYTAFEICWTFSIYLEGINANHS